MQEVVAVEPSEAMMALGEAIGGARRQAAIDIGASFPAVR